MKPLAVDVLANAIRGNPRTLAAGALAERYLRALHAAGYLVKERDPSPSTEAMDAGSHYAFDERLNRS
jgi:hypothetical protein